MTFNRTSVLIAPVVILLLFSSTLIGLDRLAFRDVSHFYLPLYDYVAQRTSDQWLPLWNPLDQTGMPLLGETTTAVLYPVRYLIFALPISASVALAWYVAGHLILASFTARWAALRSGASERAATIAGVIYPLSGSVFFLYTNPPFLVGAAWLPLVLGALIARESIATVSRCLIAAFAMAMMILGGDPQTALHVMLVASVVSIVRVIKSDARTPQRPAIIALILAPIIAAALTAPQLAASISWSSQSARVHAQDQRSWQEPPAQGSQRSDAFQFSLPPWHALELLTPNAFGELFPQNRRVSGLLAGDGRMWTPSIYLGLLAALALLCQLARRDVDQWLVIAIAALLLSLGHFGFVWLLQQIPGVLPGVDSAIGGPYWWLYQCLPGYDSFRYPVKWLPMLSLSGAIITSRWIDTTNWQESRRIIVVLAIALLIAFAAVSIYRWQARPRDSATDSYWGPLQIHDGLRQVQWSLTHSLIGLVVLATILFCWSRSHLPAWWYLLVLVVALEMGWSNHKLLACISHQDEQVLLKQAAQIMPPAKRWMRTQSGGGWPPAWRQHTDMDRMLEVAVSERLAWFGRWHLAYRQAVINNMVSIQSHNAALFWTACESVTQNMTRDQRAQFWQSMRRWLAVDGVLAVGDASHMDRQIGSWHIANVTYYDKLSAATPFRFSSRWTVAAQIDVDLVADLLRAVATNIEKSTPILHALDAARASESVGQSDTHQIRSISDRELTIGTEVAGVLSRPVFQDGHWVAEFRDSDTERWQTLPVYKISLLHQGVLLPPGNWHVRFEYRPGWLTWTLLLSLIAWISVGVVAATCWRKRQPSE